MRCIKTIEFIMVHFMKRKISFWVSIIIFFVLGTAFSILIEKFGIPSHMKGSFIGWDGELQEGYTTLYGFYVLFVAGWLAMRIHEAVSNGGFFKINVNPGDNIKNKPYKESLHKLDSCLWLIGITIFTVIWFGVEYVLFEIFFETLPGLVVLIIQGMIIFSLYRILRFYREKKVSEINKSHPI
jgi:hypothetical protein